MTLIEAIHVVVDDIRAEEFDRIWTFADAIESTRQGLTLDSFDDEDEDLYGPGVVDAYRLVLSATDVEISQALEQL
jgi:hypothetical protein